MSDDGYPWSELERAAKDTFAGRKIPDAEATRLAIALIQATPGYTLDQVAELFRETDWSNMDYLTDRDEMLTMGLALIRSAKETK